MCRRRYESRRSSKHYKQKIIKYGEKRFLICRMEFLHLQCGLWLWNHDTEFTKWQHPAMWYAVLGWHALEFAQTSAILELYIWFPFPHITAVLYQSAKFYPNRTTLGRKNDDFHDGGSQPSSINQSINQKRIKVTKVTARLLLQC